MSMCLSRHVLAVGLVVHLCVWGSARPAAGQPIQPRIGAMENRLSVRSFTLALPDWKRFGESTDAIEPRHPNPAEIPREFIPLYWSFAALQGLDAHSTLRAVEAGAHEANPLMAPFARSSTALYAIKGGATVVGLYAAERLRKRNPRMAMALMLGVNAAYGVVVVRNYRVAAEVRRPVP